MAIGTKFFFDMLNNETLTPMVILFGDACSQVTAPLAETAKFWKMLQISYADTNPVLSDNAAYPNFFRTIPSDTDFNSARIQLLRKFRWKKVATLFQEASGGTSRYSYAHNHLIRGLDSADVQIVKSESFSTDPTVAVRSLKDSGARIFLGNFAEVMAWKVFCAAYKEGLYGPKYVWIVLAGFTSRWWMDPPEDTEDIDCSPEELQEAFTYAFGTDIPELTSGQGDTVAGLKPEEYLTEYNKARNTTYARFHGYAYDGVWAIALAVQKLLRVYKGSLPLPKDNPTPFMSELFELMMNTTSFKGVTGMVQFRQGERLGEIRIEQYQGGEDMINVGYFNMSSDRLIFRPDTIAWSGLTAIHTIFLTFQGMVQFRQGERLGEIRIEQYQGGEDMINVGYFNMSSDRLIFRPDTIAWSGSGPPRDSSKQIYETQSVDIRIYIVLEVLASLGQIMAIAFLVINVKYRHHRYIKMSSPNMNNVIVIGCILTYSAVPMLGLDGSLTSPERLPYICVGRCWSLSIGFTLSFGALFSKTWRVHAIFTNVKLNRKVIKDYKLILIVLGLLVFDLIILITWQIVDPMQKQTKHLPAVERGIDMEIIPQVDYCFSTHMTIWLSILYAYKGVLLIFGCFLAWETRHVSIPALNDSKYIGMSVYNVVVLCVCGVAISFVVRDNQDASFLITGLSIILCTTITQCLVFVPKIIELKKNPKGTGKKIRATLSKQKHVDHHTDLKNKIDKLADENRWCREVVLAKDEVIQQLLDKIAEYDRLIMSGIPSDDIFPPYESSNCNQIEEFPSTHQVDPPYENGRQNSEQRKSKLAFNRSFSETSTCDSMAPLIHSSPARHVKWQEEHRGNKSKGRIPNGKLTKEKRRPLLFKNRHAEFKNDLDPIVASPPTNPKFSRLEEMDFLKETDIISSDQGSSDDES
ncbi:gamma-aminobutyric acid type B receptor subunit 2 [Lingula anatina]|uniref:Gamma-aminobutyric acid type B receptor subunit 2 n=1 Tax=Lingula anatina TaxID=7574 RepID=A0A1S3JZA5_LINAN|nr:gamma-aminobutyric acid type B receptor subunit 2 [Lingula anatina]|eukprot:XP_013415617.1 gamma-aminobutyric acid type B receptor subunit 2 [Lingula anatina]